MEIDRKTILLDGKMYRDLKDKGWYGEEEQEIF